MRILFLTQILPFPPDAGPKVKTWHVLRYLVNQGHEIILASFIRPEEVEFVPQLEAICEKVYPIPIQRSRFRDVGYFARSFFTGRPFLIERDDLREMRSLVHRILMTENIDAVHADQLTMAQFCLEGFKSIASANVSRRSPIRVFDAHNAVWVIFDRMAERVPVYLRPLVNLEAARIKSYEGKVVQEFDTTFAVTENDRIDLIKAIETYQKDKTVGDDPEKITVIPIAVDAQALTPVERRPSSLNILTLGTLHYPPNADGIRWFVHEVFPLIQKRIRGVTLTIIGKNPPSDFKKLAEDHSDSIRVTGYVPDLDPYMRQSALVVVPVLAGGGMRVRILEAFARAMPVVTTTVGLEGIEAQDRTDVYIGDTPQEFANCVIELLDDETKQRKLASNGRRLAETKYDWNKTLEKLSVIYKKNGAHRG